MTHEPQVSGRPAFHVDKEFKKAAKKAATAFEIEDDHVTIIAQISKKSLERGDGYHLACEIDIQVLLKEIAKLRRENAAMKEEIEYQAARHVPYMSNEDEYQHKRLSKVLSSLPQ
jgi:hypothetical protein